MKAIKITYWITTVIIAVMSVLAGYMYLANPEIQKVFHTIGFPDFFREELAAGKFIGSALLLFPVWNRLKEWTYAGFTIVYISAFIMHNSIGDIPSKQMMPLIFLAILFVSYYTFRKLQLTNVKA